MCGGSDLPSRDMVEEGDSPAYRSICLFAKVMSEHVTRLRSISRLYPPASCRDPGLTRISVNRCHCILVNSTAKVFGSTVKT
mgnify:CR=1 FL=1|jgi:hypothetical protein